MTWETAVVLLAARMQHLMRRPLFALCLDALCAVGFLALAVTIAIESLRTHPSQHTQLPRGGAVICRQVVGWGCMVRTLVCE